MADAITQDMYKVPKLRTIRLYGALGAKFGREFRLAVASTAEAIRALSAQLPGFSAYLNGAKERGMVFAVFLGKRNIGEQQLTDPPGADVIRIAPVMEGAKRAGVLQTIIGAVLIVVGAFLYYTPAGVPLINLGVALLAGGISQMLSPQPKGLGSKDSPDNQASYSFNGPVNTEAEGNSVPVGYGRCWGGSAVISGGVYAEDQA
ncbi:MAG TPA: tail assembly protein [Stenotrophomonas sp.]|nr:tail assembly protein [Stenotrophomonas sp.]